MILEVAILTIKAGQAAQFEKDFAAAGEFIQSINGYIKHSLSKCIEHDNKYVLLVEWQKLEDHTVGFRQSPQYLQWKALLHHYYEPFPVVEHYEMVIEHTN